MIPPSRELPASVPGRPLQGVRRVGELACVNAAAILDQWLSVDGIVARIDESSRKRSQPTENLCGNTRLDP